MNRGKFKVPTPDMIPSKSRKGKEKGSSEQFSSGSQLGGEWSYQNSPEVLIAFLETVLHTILYIRSVYPSGTFVRRQRWKTPVWQSTHSELNRYIKEALKAIEEDLKKRMIEKIVVILKNSSGSAFERWIFAIQDVPDTSRESLLFDNIEQCFRRVMQKISIVESTLRPPELEDSGSFSIVIEMRNNSRPKYGEHKFTSKHGMVLDVDDRSEMHLIRTVDLGTISLTMVVQQINEDPQSSEEKIPQRGAGREEIVGDSEEKMQCYDY